MIYDSIIVTGSAQVSGSLSVTGGITGSFQGTATTASYVLNAVSASFATSASYAVSASTATNAVTSSHALNAVSASFTTSAANATTSSYILNAASASYALTSSFATTAVTASFANAFTVAGTLTATTLVVQTITSSVDFVTGSTRFGSLLANTHAFTGSVGMTGSLAVNGSVGVGTASPSQLLHLYTTSKAVSDRDGINLQTSNSAAADIGLPIIWSSNGTILNYATAGIAGRRESATSTNYSGYLQFATTDAGGSLGERMRITSGGNVGIGTTTITPSSGYKMLKINGSTGGEFVLAGSDVDYGYIYANSGNFVIDALGNYPLIFRVNGSSRMTITASGSVGIGTASPTGRLMLYQSSAGNVLQNIVSNQGGSTQAGINFSPSMTDTEVAANPAQASIYATDSNYGANIIFANKATGAVGNALTERMRITSGGNVGIGTTSPSVITAGSTVLEVSGVGDYFPSINVARTGGSSKTNSNWGFVVATDGGLIFRHNTSSSNYMSISTSGSATFSSAVSVQGNSGIYIYRSDNTRYGLLNTDNNYTYLVSNTSPADPLLLGTGGSSYITFGKNFASTYVEQMRITSDGNIAIGTFATAGDKYFGYSHTNGGWGAGASGLRFESVAVGGNYSQSIYIRTHYYNADSRNAIYCLYDGNVYNFSNSTAWQTTSDIRIKENIRPINNALDKINALNPSHFEYKNKLGQTKTGFVAQEFEQIFPGHVSEGLPNEDYKEYFKEGEMMKSIDADLIPYLVKAIQELKAENDTLKDTLQRNNII